MCDRLRVLFFYVILNICFCFCNLDKGFFFCRERFVCIDKDYFYIYIVCDVNGEVGSVVLGFFCFLFGFYYIEILVVSEVGMRENFIDFFRDFGLVGR